MPDLPTVTDQDLDILAQSRSHPSVASLLRFFKYQHLPHHLQSTSQPCAQLAFYTVKSQPDSAELSAGLRHLLEAKDCFVRAALPDE